MLEKEIRCQFIILRKSGVSSSFLPEKEIRCQFIILKRKSGVSSSFLPEKMNRHRITPRITRRKRASMKLNGCGLTKTGVIIDSSERGAG